MVSVIIPTFNRRKLLLEAVDSVLKQTFCDLELIVVDDGSTDDTVDRVLGLRDSRLRLIQQSRRGVSSARNRGIDAAAYSWIAFLDSDDLWMPAKLEKQLETLRRNPEYPAVYTNEIWIRRGVRVNPGKVHRKHGGWIFSYCLPRCIVSPSSILLNRGLFDRFGKFSESLPVCEDYDLWLRMSSRKPFFYLDEPLIIKRGGHQDQLSKSTWGFDRFRVQSLVRLMESAELTPRLQRLTAREIVYRCQILIIGCRKRGKLIEAQRFQEIADWASDFATEELGP